MPRIDEILTKEGFYKSRTKAKDAVSAGFVFYNGKQIKKPSEKFNDINTDFVKCKKEKYVSRGGLKLEKALSSFSINPQNKICLDIGSSTGGFTDCLLQHGAAKVYAVDNGTGQLDKQLSKSNKIVLKENLNARDTDWSFIKEPVQLIVIDVSFVSLEKIFQNLLPFKNPGLEIAALYKPQFQLLSKTTMKNGVIKNRGEIRNAFSLFKKRITDLGFYIHDFTKSPIKGKSGNQEYLLHIGREINALKRDIVNII